ncbi:hypothetical protein [Rickettsia montanensis]|uniref:Uncharacterized protein n=1 Tax=Rickettsia montanensis (strain OSU 85-930) TaxID=1105114 RepID=H8KBF6_RICMS|nr:hypothetical protein [Rickettsia montanensis]AFC73747.1 hypothetical protein MCI_04590 [Rickettsia montanensis str. OSU 85-930]
MIGLTKTELADYMLSLNVIGDEDEALGEHLVRPVSDAIVLYQII